MDTFSQVNTLLLHTKDEELILFLNQIKEFIIKREECDDISFFNHYDHYNDGWSHYIDRLALLKTALEKDEISD